MSVGLRAATTLGVLVASLLAAGTRARAQAVDPSERARALYGQAAYEDALAAREAFARGDYQQAQAGFSLLLDLAADPAVKESYLAPILGDLSVIAASYPDLSARLGGAADPADRPAAADGSSAAPS